VRRLGWTQDELAQLDNPLSAFYSDAQVAAVLEHIELADGQFREYQVRAKDGSTRIQLWANFRTPQTRSTISVGHDITEQREIESQLHQAQKMDAVGRLTGGIAHDFNNLLTVVLAGADLLLPQLEDGSPAHALATQIRSAAQDGAELVRQLGSFSRQRLLRLTPVNLRALLDEVGPTLRRLLPASIEVRILHAPESVHIQGDITSLKQILMNLATNARDAIARRGMIEIATRVLPGAPHGRVVLSVRDTGEGMAPEVRDRVFEPFFTTKAPGLGTGLGLPTVYGLTLQHGGTMTLASEPGQGTRVEITLPMLPAVADDGPESTTDLPTLPRGTEQILLVEDDDGARLVAERALAHLGYEVLVAEDGEEALGILARDLPIALILSDVVMPRMTGPELLERLRSRPEPMPAFAFCSGYSSRDTAGPLDPTVPMLAKPWAVPALAAFIRRCIDGHPPS
jgi:signal transduction histidine kinase